MRESFPQTVSARIPWCSWVVSRGDSVGSFVLLAELCILPSLGWVCAPALSLDSCPGLWDAEWREMPVQSNFGRSSVLHAKSQPGKPISCMFAGPPEPKPKWTPITDSLWVLDSVILVGPFELGTFCDSMILPWNSMGELTWSVRVEMAGNKKKKKYLL